MDTSIIDRLTSLFKSENAKLTLCAVTASLITASSIYAYQSTSRHHQSLISKQQTLQNASLPHRTIQLNDAGGPDSASEPLTQTSNINSHPYDEDLIEEQLSRNYLFFTEAGMSEIRDSFVVVVGVGGVGSWATTMLVRSGISRIRIIDFDQVTLSSLNRHAVATLEDVGTSKVATLVAHLKKVAPWVEFDMRYELFEASQADRLLEPWQQLHHNKDTGAAAAPSFVIDAIDNLVTKADLLAYCHNHSIPCIASMGAGCKSDPTRIRICDISETSEDPLSRATRRHLKLRGISSGIPVVFSTEKPGGPGKATLAVLDPTIEVGKSDEYAILPDFRARIMPVLGTMPAIFGLTLATFVLTTLAGYPTEPTPTRSTRPQVSMAILQELGSQGSSDSAAGVGRVPISTADVQFLIDECAAGRSMLPPYYPCSPSSRTLTVTLYDPELPLSLDNLIVLTKEEAKMHKVIWQSGGYSEIEKEALKRGVEKSRALQRWREG